LIKTLFIPEFKKAIPAAIAIMINVARGNEVTTTDITFFLLPL
jgi:hypothetical protein